MMIKKLFQLCLLILVVIGLAMPVEANPIETDLARVSLVSEVSSVKAGDTFWVAFRWQMRPKWHIYWQNPGDSGARPTLKWQLPEGFTVGDIVFPSPQRFIIPPLPLANFGYENDIYLPVQVRSPAQLTQLNQVNLKVRADWLICNQECIPESGELSLSLPVGDGTITSEKQRLFQQIRQTLPQKVSKPLQFQATAQEIVLNLGDLPEFNDLSTDRKLTFFPAQDGTIVNAAEQRLEMRDGKPVLRLQRGYQTDLRAIQGVLVEGDRGWQVQGSLTTGSNVSANALTEQAQTGFLEAMGLALLGGIILNLMPCILPILSLRALSIASLSQQSPRAARLSGFAFTGGVLACFGTIAISLLVLRSLGQAIGWGFQLQSPLVVLSLVYLLFAVGLNLSGVFAIGSGWMAVGQNLASRSGLAGEFFTGVLAVLMSTPCTAPFMATAISAALVLPELPSFLILMALGLGFALPYLLLCLAPPLQKLLPKPGAWLGILPQVLAFPIYGTAGWLLWVYHLQAGSEGLAIALVGLVLIGFGAWLYGKTQMARSFWRRVGIIGTGLSLTLCLLLFPLIGNLGSTSGIAWETYSPDRVLAVRQAGKPVFVEFTAAWCAGCLINERTTFAQAEVQQEFKRRNVVMLKADWTNRDDQITKALQKYGSSGVPLYVLYGVNMKQEEPVILPKTLTPQLVLEALDQFVPLS